MLDKSFSLYWEHGLKSSNIQTDCGLTVRANLEVVKDESLPITMYQVAVVAVDEVCQRAVNVSVPSARAELPQ